ELDRVRVELGETRGQIRQELERVAGMTAGEAKEHLLQEIEDEVRQDANRRVREVESEAKEEAERRARKIVVTAMQRCAADTVSEHVNSVVHLPSDVMKGRIIGREVRNFRALVAATGVDMNIAYPTDEVPIHGFVAPHFEEEPQGIDPYIVSIADAISGARPGARRETVEHYIRRLEALEGVANSFPGVEKAFAIQAGREVRILVRPEDVDDLGAVRLARDIVKKIEDTLEYPGQIKVTLIRETRAIEYAR